MERFLTINEGQVAGLLGAAEPELRTALLLASAAGLRVVEMQELKWADVDLGRGVLTVTPNNRTQRHREIPIHPMLRKQLGRWRSQEPARETVFASPEVQDRLRNKLHGLRGHFVGGVEIRFHDLRAWLLKKVQDASVELWTEKQGHRPVDQYSHEEMRAVLIRALQFVADW